MFFRYQEPLDECRRGHVMRKPNSSLPTLGKALALLGEIVTCWTIELWEIVTWESNGQNLFVLNLGRTQKVSI